MGWVFFLGVLAVGGYLLSLRLHPFRSCPACKSGRHPGSVYTYSHRRCRRCGGTNRQERLGTRLGLGGPRENLPGRGRGGALLLGFRQLPGGRHPRARPVRVAVSDSCLVLPVRPANSTAAG
jgi:hypothetical protein